METDLVLLGLMKVAATLAHDPEKWEPVFG